MTESKKMDWSKVAETLRHERMLRPYADEYGAHADAALDLVERMARGELVEPADAVEAYKRALAPVANIRAALNTFATTAEAEAFVQEQVAAADRVGYERGRAEGRADVGKYSNAVGRIESLVGLAGAMPLSETVAEVARQLEAARTRCAELERERDKLQSKHSRLVAAARALRLAVVEHSTIDQIDAIDLLDVALSAEPPAPAVERELVELLWRERERNT